MAEIFNQKEEVISLELTKHGRKTLGLGVFQPEFYEFFDDTIIYDLKYYGITEQQNISKSRILDDSLTLKSLNITEDMLKAPLGNSSITNNLAPAWDLNLLKGEIEFLQVSSSYAKNVFSSSNIQYNISLEEKNLSDQNISSFMINDQTLIIEDDYLLIDLKELNVDDDYKNFELEVVTFDDLSGGIAAGLERKLTFLIKQSNIIDGIIYSDDELPSRFNDIKITKNDVNYYLDVLVDEEIDKQIISKTPKTIQEQLKGTYTSTFEGPAKEDC